MSYQVSDRSCSPVSVLSENGSEDSYILVSTSHHSRSSSNEWDDMHEELKHDEQHHDDDMMEHEHDKEHEQQQPSSPHDHEIPTPQRIIPIDMIPSLDHTIDIAQSDDETDDQPCMESIYQCQFHEDAEEEPSRNLSMSQSFMEPPSVDVASLHVCDDTEPELEPIVDGADMTEKHVDEVIEASTTDDAPDYPIASASTMLCDDWEHKHDYPINDDFHDPYDSIPHVYIDEYGYSHFPRHPNFCIGEQECWEAKHIHDENFYYDPSTGTWLRGAPDNDLDYEDSRYDTYDDPIDIPINQKSQIHNKITFKPTRTRSTRIRQNHTHIHKQQWQETAQPSSPSSPSTPSPPTTYASLRRRHGRGSRSPTPTAEPEVIRPVRPGSHKRRGPNFYERIRGREQNHTYVSTQHQYEQHLHDMATRTVKPSSVLDHVHGTNCTIQNCVHCRHVMRSHKERKETKNRRMDRDLGNKMESVLSEEAWE